MIPRASSLVSRAAALVALAASLAAQRPAVTGETSCIVCHPAAARGLASSLHASLLQRPDAAEHSCSACHGDLSAHVAAQAMPGDAAVRVPKVAATSCAVCHPGRNLATEQGSHPARPLPSSAGPLPDPTAGVVQALEQREEESSFRWSGLVDLGYRFADVHGSQDRYDTDINLDDGVRLHTLETRLLGGGKSFADEVSLDAHDIGDPRWDVAAKVRKDGAYEAQGSYRRDRYHYLASGDYHRVDRDSQVQDYGGEVSLSKDVRVFGSFVRSNDEGFWLTQRIGNRAVNVQSYVDGVSSPRDYDSDTSTLGLAGDLAGWKWTASADYLDEHGIDRWSYVQPAPANPAFDESEDFGSRTSLYGPGGKLALSRDFEDWSIDLTARYVDHSRGLGADGQSQGFDIAQYTTVTEASGDGSAQTWLLDGSSSFSMTKTLRTVADVHWRDHHEAFLLRQTDVTSYPTLGTQTTVVTDQDQRTTQRLVDGSLSLEWDATEELMLTIGYGGSREELTVPDLVPTDPRDYRSGTVRDNGVLAGLDWRFAPHWRLRGDLRDFGQDGVYLHELAPERARTASGKLSYTDKQWRGSTFVRHRFVNNDVSDHRLENFATGLHAGVTRGTLSLDADYTFARTDTRTLTNFYFDPDPNPQTTYVGFEGDTHTVAATLGMEPSAGVHWEATAVWTDTLGSIDLGTMDWRLGMRVDVVAQGAAGVEFRQIRYREDGSSDNYDAALLWLYWRQSF